LIFSDGRDGETADEIPLGAPHSDNLIFNSATVENKEVNEIHRCKQSGTASSGVSDRKDGFCFLKGRYHEKTKEAEQCSGSANVLKVL
jgi:hypothetical protein